MNTVQDLNTAPGDPLGLRELPDLEPPEANWGEIERSLAGDRRRRLFRRISGMAVAASILFAVVLVTQLTQRHQNPGSTTPAVEASATLVAASASDDRRQTLGGLITMSQTLEQQLRSIREGSGSMPAASAVYVAELEDLVAQVDNQLSISPNSVNLWGQRVNLLLDLAQLYQHQWEREYGRMASL